MMCMDLDYTAYPNQAWVSNWPLTPFNINPISRTAHASSFYTDKLEGRVNIRQCEMALQLNLQRMNKKMLLHDLIGAYTYEDEDEKKIEILCMNTTTLWGRCIQAPLPKLLNDHLMSKRENALWFDDHTITIYYEIHDDQFCLIVNAPVESRAREQAATLFSTNFDQELAERWNERKGIARQVTSSFKNNALHLLMSEQLIQALRPSSSSIPGIWSITDPSQSDVLYINDFLMITDAWAELDLSIATDLLQTVRKLQTTAGILPFSVHQHGSMETLIGTLPLYVKTASRILIENDDPTLTHTFMPSLSSYLVAIFKYYDPKKSGIHRWRHEKEPVVSGIYEKDLATADLSSLLLSEIEAYEKLTQRFPESASSFYDFSSTKELLIEQLSDLFWHKEKGSFCYAMTRETKQLLSGIPAFLPMLSSTAVRPYREQLLDQLKSSSNQAGSLNIAFWREHKGELSSDLLIEKWLFFSALHTTDPNGILLYDYTQVTINRFDDWYRRLGVQKNSLSPNPMQSAFFIRTHSFYKSHYQTENKFISGLIHRLKKANIDRVDLAIFAVTFMLLLAIRIYYSVAKTPPPLSSLTAEMNQFYMNYDVLNTLRLCEEIMTHYPEQADFAKLIYCNLSLQNQYYQEAQLLLEQIRMRYPDSPGPMLLQAVCYHLLEQYDKADRIYYEFVFLFDEIFPKLIEKAKFYQFLSLEKIPLPSTWEDIFAFKQLHEIE